MRIYLAQINPTVGDIKGNLRLIEQRIQHAQSLGADVVLFPEMALSGYPPEDMLLLSGFIDDLDEALKHLLSCTKGIAAVVGTARRVGTKGEKTLCNSAAVIDNGVLLGFQDKILLPTYDVFDERRFFQAGKEAHLWNLAGKKVGITICEDIWEHSALLKYASYQRNPVQEIAALHPDVVLNLSASPFSVTKVSNRFKVCSRASAAMGAPLLLCNQVGGNDSLIFDGRSMAVDEKGNLLAMAAGFEQDGLLVDLSVPYRHVEMVHDDMDDLYKGLVLGIKDYFHKSGFSKACLGLSGGIDSALVACLAVEALGKDNVCGVLMPSRYSSPGSTTDAMELVRNLQITHMELPIEQPFEAYLDLFKKSSLGSVSGVAEENLQARIRGMILMALSNKAGYIVLSTGNKSELAMGYSTLYGDMCGGLAVISDLTKQQVYALSKWINRNGEVIPSHSITKPPSAELRPNQKDSDSLPDYAIVDNVLQAYIEDHQSAGEISRRFGYTLPLVEDLVRRIHANEYKRRQSPPGLRVSEKAFSVGRRFPIVQGYV